MEFCQGGDLAGFLKKRGGHVPESTARGFMRHIGTCRCRRCSLTHPSAATGMAYLQEHNLIHRDLKPHNLLLSKDSASVISPSLSCEASLTIVIPQAVVKIADFGFARMIAPTTLADTMCGSPLYMVCVARAPLPAHRLALRPQKYSQARNMI